MTLPRKIPKSPKRSSRWRSPSHCAFVRSFHCAMCGSSTNVQAAHVRNGSRAGLSQKPDDFLCVPLCAGPNSNVSGGSGCHDWQHEIGEGTFWNCYEERHGQTVEQLQAELCKASPKRAEIERIKRERNDG